MVIFGKRLSEYVSFCRPFLILVLAIGIGRLLLSLGGISNASAKWLSMSVVTWIAVLYYAVRIHTSGFGSYKQLLPVTALINLAAQAVAILGISIAMITGAENIFSAPEYSFGGTNPWIHLGAHLAIGTTMGTLFPWIVGCGVMAVTKKTFGVKHERNHHVPQL
jgi:hypothetical protein